jgi:hypothetical protein
VGVTGNKRCARGVNLGHRTLALSGASCGNHHARAFARESVGNGAADFRVTPGYQYHSFFELCRHELLLLNTAL